MEKTKGKWRFYDFYGILIGFNGFFSGILVGYIVEFNDIPSGHLVGVHWNMTGFFIRSVGNVRKSQLTNSNLFQRGGKKPPTKHI